MDDVENVKVLMAKALIKHRIREKGDKVSCYSSKDIRKIAKEYASEHSYQELERDFFYVCIKP